MKAGAATTASALYQVVTCSPSRIHRILPFVAVFQESLISGVPLLTLGARRTRPTGKEVQCLSGFSGGG
jgi:hypothetical protein